MLHPNREQRTYLLNMFARQLYGDNGNELFHVHAGFQGSVGNGKTKFFHVLEHVLGNYIHKFPVQVLTTAKREDAGKPQPEYQHWHGRRILYCTEPNAEDVLNSGIMKDLTGGEAIQYRLLFSNEIMEFRPQYKMHIMCNDPPKVDGADSGVVRRVRKLDYVSRFVDDDMVDETQHMYPKDESFFDLLKSNMSMRMEVMRYLLSLFRKNYAYPMPNIIKEASKLYLDENNAVQSFVSTYLKRKDSAFFTLAEAKIRFRLSEVYNGKIGTFKNDLLKILKVPCHAQKKVEGKKLTNVFEGYELVCLEGDIDVFEDSF